MAARNQKILFTNIMAMHDTDQPQVMLHEPISQKRLEMSSTAFLTVNQAVLLETLRAKKPNAFIRIEKNKKACCVVL